MQKNCLVQPALAGGACRERLSPPLCTAYEPSAISDQLSSLHTTHPPRTKEQPQACSRCRRSLTAPEQSKAEKSDRCWQAAPASAGHTAKHFASASHQRAAASLLEWSAIPDGSSAKQRRKRMTVVSKQLLRVPARQPSTLHLPRTEEQPQACSRCRRSMTASEQSKGGRG